MINGLAGIGRVLLAAVTACHPAAERGLTAALEALTKMIMSPRGTRPGWWLPAAMHPPTVKSDLSGSAATGMAHGIAGPLACLAAASTGGWSVPCQDAAIRHAARWLLDWKAGETWQWPSSVSGAELDASEAASAITAASGPNRPSAIPRLGAVPHSELTRAVSSAGWKPTSRARPG